MARYFVDSFSTGSLAAGATQIFTRPIGVNAANIMKVKVEPNIAVASSCIRIFGKADGDPTSMYYSSDEFIGDFVDPVSDDGAAITEINEGFLAVYNDDDDGQSMYVKIYNDHTDVVSFTVTITYEVAEAVAARESVTGGKTFTNFADQDWWIPFYMSEYIDITYNGAGSMKWSSRGDDLTVNYWGSAARPRFIVYPVSGRLKYRVLFEDVTISGPLWSACQMAAGMVQVMPHGNYNGPGMGFATYTGAVDRILHGMRADNANQLNVNAFDSDYYETNVYMGTSPFDIEFVLTMGTNTAGNGTEYWKMGVVMPECTYSINGAAHTPYGAASGAEPYDNWEDAQYGSWWLNLFPPIIVFHINSGVQSVYECTLTEFEVVEGTILRTSC
jgi:hypothetical protein